MSRTSLFRTSSFRLAASYLALFTVSVIILGAVVYGVVWREIADDVDGDIRSETAVLLHDYAAHGLDHLRALIEARTEGGGSFVYSLQDADGGRLAGDLDAAGDRVGWTFLRRPGAGSPKLRALITRLDAGGALIVGDDWSNERSTTHTIVLAFVWALVGTLALGALGGLALSSQVLKRIGAMNDSALRIVAGDWRQRISDRGANDELAELARTFNRVFDRIESLLAAHKHVGDNIAHDLRRPLGRTMRRLEAARGEGSTARDAEAAIDGAISDIEGVLETFDAILRIGQIEAGARRAGFKRVDLAIIAQEVAEAFQPAADDEGKTLTAVLSCPLLLSGDRELLTQMVANLIDNALRHTPRGTRIVVTSERLPGELRLRVSDNGPGVPANEHARIFERFYRLDAARTTPGGGLGLSLVAAIAELHGLGCVAYDNSPGLLDRNFAAGAGRLIKVIE